MNNLIALLFVIVLFPLTIFSQDCDSLRLQTLHKLKASSESVMFSMNNKNEIAKALTIIKAKLEVTLEDTLKCENSLTSNLVYEKHRFLGYSVEMLTISDDYGYVELGYDPIFNYTVVVYTIKGIVSDQTALDRAVLVLLEYSNSK